MPELGTIEDCRVFFYTNEGNLEGLPRVFVQRRGAEAEFILSQDEVPVVLLRRSHGFDALELDMLRSRIAPLGAEIRRSWNNLFC